MKKPPNPIDGVLVSPARLEKFLAAFANTGPELAGARWLLAQFPEFFPPGYLESGGAIGYGAEHGELEMPLKHSPEVYALTEISRLAKRFRGAWKERDQRVREWCLFEVRKAFHGETEPANYEPPAFTPFEQAIFHFQRNWDRVRYCENATCPAHYFFGKHRKPQKYCSSICAGPAKKEAKLRWWNAHPEAHKKKQ